MTDIMDFEQFTDELKSALIIRYPDESVEIKRVTKNNGVIYTGLSIHNDSENVYPTMYLDRFYEEVGAEGLTDELIDRICEVYEDRRVGNISIPDTLWDYDHAKSNLRARLINYESNEEFLKEVVHRRFMDLAIVPYYLFTEELFSGSDGCATFVVRNKNLEFWDVDAETLIDECIDNTFRACSPEITSIYEMLRRLRPDFEGYAGEDTSVCPMYIMTAGDINGAVAMLCEDKLREFCRENDRDMFIIPSSINEVILIPYEEGMSTRMIDEMIMDVNATELNAVEILSDHVYFFSKDEGYVSVPSAV